MISLCVIQSLSTKSKHELDALNMERYAYRNVRAKLDAILSCNGDSIIWKPGLKFQPVWIEPEYYSSLPIRKIVYPESFQQEFTIGSQFSYHPEHGSPSLFKLHGPLRSFKWFIKYDLLLEEKFRRVVPAVASLLKTSTDEQFRTLSKEIHFLVADGDCSLTGEKVLHAIKLILQFRRDLEQRFSDVLLARTRLVEMLAYSENRKDKRRSFRTIIRFLFKNMDDQSGVDEDGQFDKNQPLFHHPTKTHPHGYQRLRRGTRTIIRQRTRSIQKTVI